MKKLLYYTRLGYEIHFMPESVFEVTIVMQKIINLEKHGFSVHSVDNRCLTEGVLNFHLDSLYKQFS
jgi:hypothetical protein